MRPTLRLAPLAALLLVSFPARALELGQLDERPLRLDITASTLASWHGDNRNSLVYDDDYGDLVNRINLQLSYWRLVAALRLDTATFANVPDATALAFEHAEDPNDLEEVQGRQRGYWESLRSRYRGAYDLGKASLSYTSPNLEVTLGDSYVSFGRGLALSLRKQDELAVDTTLLGGKVVARSSWINGIAVAGIANPVRVDQSSGESLYPLDPDEADLAAGREGPAVYGQDRIVGLRTELTHWGAALGLHGVRMTRAEPLGSSLGAKGADTVDVVGSSLSAPLPGDVGSVWLEGAWQRWAGDSATAGRFEGDGYALYGSVSGEAGPLTGLVELQHYRDFDPLSATVDRVSSFYGLRYSASPTTEPATIDTRYGSFDRCVSGGRARVDGKVHEQLSVWGAFGQWATWGERSSGCETSGPEAMRNDVSDATAGVELVFDGFSSHVFASGGHRRDVSAELDDLYYREWHGELSAVKQLPGPWSLELDLRERRRFNGDENRQLPTMAPRPWNEGEVYLSLKYSPMLVAAVGFEHTDLAGEAPRYFNGMLLWKYLPGSSVKLFAGQQRGALKCVSGICRQFPPFEGVKLEWTQRY